jgi:hypothetical protein
MRDRRGLFYYPNPANKKIHMYVRQESGQICFRLWNADDPDLWREHGWVPYEAIRRAQAMYTGKKFDPAQAYDLDLARALLAEEGGE